MKSKDLSPNIGHQHRHHRSNVNLRNINHKITQIKFQHHQDELSNL